MQNWALSRLPSVKRHPDDCKLQQWARPDLTGPSPRHEKNSSNHSPCFPTSVYIHSFLSLPYRRFGCCVWKAEPYYVLLKTPWLVLQGAAHHEVFLPERSDAMLSKTALAPRGENINNPDERVRELPILLTQPRDPQYFGAGVKVWLLESYMTWETQF